MEPNNYLKNIKSKYILEKIFDNMKITKCLNIIRYNKNIQKRLSKNINDYKEYLQTLIEIIPSQSNNKNQNKFMNITNQNFYHIYFNDNKSEIKRNYIGIFDEVSKIKVLIDYEVKSINGLFEGCECIKEVNFIKMNRKDINDLSKLFEGCSSLTILDLSNLNTINAIDMRNMLTNCCSL